MAQGSLLFVSNIWHKGSPLFVSTMLGSDPVVCLIYGEGSLVDVQFFVFLFSQYYSSAFLIFLMSYKNLIFLSFMVFKREESIFFNSWRCWNFSCFSKDFLFRWAFPNWSDLSHSFAQINISGFWLLSPFLFNILNLPVLFFLYAKNPLKNKTGKFKMLKRKGDKSPKPEIFIWANEWLKSDQFGTAHPNRNSTLQQEKF